MKEPRIINLMEYKAARASRICGEQGRLNALKDLVIKHLCNKPVTQTTLNWINVQERLPESGKEMLAVLVESLNGKKWISHSQFVNGEFIHGKGGFMIVTHWAKLPKDLP
jgi:hypothetical protein